MLFNYLLNHFLYCPIQSNAYMNCLSPPLLFPFCRDKTIKKWIFDPTSLPSGKRMGSYREFMMLPESKHHCSKVDRVHGLWALCGLCAKKIICRFERSYTVAHWNDHEKTPEHNNHIRHLDEITELDLKKKALGETLTSLEATTLGQLTKKQSPMAQFFSATASKKDVFKKVSAENPITPAERAATASADALEGSASAPSTKRKPITCEGIMPDFRGAIKDHIAVYCLYAATDAYC